MRVIVWRDEWSSILPISTFKSYPRECGISHYLNARPQTPSIHTTFTFNKRVQFLHSGQGGLVAAAVRYRELAPSFPPDPVPQ
jgi:hypothetical protein